MHRRLASLISPLALLSALGILLAGQVALAFDDVDDLLREVFPTMPASAPVQSAASTITKPADEKAGVEAAQSREAGPAGDFVDLFELTAPASERGQKINVVSTPMAEDWAAAIADPKQPTATAVSPDEHETLAPQSAVPEPSAVLLALAALGYFLFFGRTRVR